ncbi:extracellular solute-binding protein [Streptomyces sp. 3MP-14]|uniref:Extracellular solute-binding protein n=1 Tax=Streptomyces mimosae TaxID=2586635 RepID=A0A5N6AJ62_9ACTN|nr:MULTISPECIES: sugar ABC transporter substrate-binding protein [Streptomyces]KAB8168704.1 extracellular solute-binding protein [Streptomyces mimosae]KAB8178016.1 extracellular solute-binding protein [Streptomyces sp. 3MP-14]
MGLTRGQFLRLMGAGAAGALLSACATSPPPIDVTGPEFTEAEPSGTVKLWSRGGLLPTAQRIVDRFHAAQDRIRVDLTPVPDGQFVTKLATAIRGGRVPDVVDIDDINSALFVARGVFADLTPLLDELPFRDRLSPGHLALVERDGRYFGAPSIADNSTLWCNVGLFERAGVDIDQVTGSFEGYLEAARAVSALGDDIHGWFFPGNSAGALAFTVQPHVWAAGTDLIAGEIGDQRGNIVDNEPLRATLEFLRALWEEGLTPPAIDSDDGSRWASQFQAGRVGMMPCGFGIVTPDASDELLDQCGVRLLSGPEGGRSFFDGGTNFCLPNGSDNPSAAWEFVRFCLELEQQTALPETGYIPVRSDAATDEFRAAYPLAAPPLLELDAGYAPLSLAYARIYNQNDGPWLAMIREAVFGGNVDRALAAAQPRFDEILRQGDA